MMNQASNQSRMFRSIVLMGSGLAFGCGGKAGVDGQAGSAGSPTSAAGDFAGGAAAGGAFATGGAFSAGGPSFGGAPTAGATSTAGASGAPECPPSQWTCSAPAECNYETGWVPSGCSCDSKRPAKSSDCKVGQAFVCLIMGSASADSKAQGLQCSCVPSASDCSQECVEAFGNAAGNLQCDVQAPSGAILCGCAIVLLK